MKKSARDQERYGAYDLPEGARDYIALVIKKMRYRKKIRTEVRAELAGHFEDAIKECASDEEKNRATQELIAEFGDAKMLASLLRRAKKRCRPLWKKCLIRAFIVIEIIILYTMLRGAFLFVGSPEINTNYVDWLNQSVAVHGDDIENAWMDYDRAVERYVEIPSDVQKQLDALSANGNFFTEFDDCNDVEKQQIAAWLDQNRHSLDALRQGAVKEHYWSVYEPQEFGILQEVMPPIMDAGKGYRQIARAMGWQIFYEAHQGKLSEALNDCLVLQHFGMHLQGQGLLIEQLIGIAIEGLAEQKIFTLLERQDSGVEALRAIYPELRRCLTSEKSVMDLTAEKAFWYDMIQRGFTDDGNGNGHVLTDGIPFVIKDVPSSLTDFFLWNFPDRREVTAMVDVYYENAEYLMNETPYEIHFNKPNAWNKISGIGGDYLLLKMLGGSFEHLGRTVGRRKAGRAGLLATVAVVLYEKENGQYPLTLDVLVVKGYLEQVPMDPYSDKAMVYKITDDGFMVYSVGENFVDDGRQVVRYTTGKDKGKVEKWASEGDWVFWPVGR